MKSNIVLSEEAMAKLRNVMEIRGFDSLEFTADFVIAEGERKALLIKKLYAESLPDAVWASGAFYSEEELEMLRAMDVPQSLRNDAA